MKLYFEVFDYFSFLTIYLQPLCATHASFGGGGVTYLYNCSKIFTDFMEIALTHI